MLSITKTEELLTLMSIYREEWKFRDNYFSSILWRFLSLSLIITFLPNLVSNIGVSGTVLIELPTLIYSIAGIICALFGIYLSLCEAKKVEKLDEAYKDLMAKLPEDYKVKSILEEELKNKKRIFSFRTNNMLCGIFVIVIILAVINILVN